MQPSNSGFFRTGTVIGETHRRNSHAIALGVRRELRSQPLILTQGPSISVRPPHACVRGFPRTRSVRWWLPLAPHGNAPLRMLAQKYFLKYLSISSSPPQYSTSLLTQPRTLRSTMVVVSGRRTDSGAMPARIAAITPAASQ